MKNCETEINFNNGQDLEKFNNGQDLERFSKEVSSELQKIVDEKGIFTATDLKNVISSSDWVWDY